MVRSDVRLEIIIAHRIQGHHRIHMNDDVKKEVIEMALICILAMIVMTGFIWVVKPPEIPTIANFFYEAFYAY